MRIDSWVEILSLVGIGAILQAFINYLIQTWKGKNEARLTFKAERYKAILLLTCSLANYEIEHEKLRRKRPGLLTRDDLVQELKAECINMTLFGSDNAILALKEFIFHSTEDNLNKTVLEFRRDLYSIRSKLKYHQLRIQRSPSNSF